jgi:integrase/recombinase XerD
VPESPLAIPSRSPLDQTSLIALTFLSDYLNPNTRNAYRKDLEIFFEWCFAVGLDPLQARRLHIQAFIAHLVEGRGNGSASVARRIGTLGGFYRTAVMDGHIDFSPTTYVKVPPVFTDPARLTWLNRWELAALARAAMMSKKQADWALVNLMAVLGMRVSAACNVQIADISTDGSGYRWLHTIGKSGKPSMKVLPIPTWEPLERARDGREVGPLLRRRDGSQMTRRSADRVIQRLAKAAGIERHISPHSLRRTFVTSCLKAGVPLHVVQEAVDHARASTTLAYNRLEVDPNASASITMAALLAGAA